MDLTHALIMENWIVDGLTVTCSRSWSLCSTYDTLSYSLGDGVKVYGYEFDEESVHGSDISKKPRSGDAELQGTSSAACGFPKESLHMAEGTNVKSRINSWLREILQDSPSVKIIIFHKMGHQSLNFSDLHVWLEKVLEFWDLDEDTPIIDEADNLSDGAVDSRGSLRSKGS